jgi:Uma2 family endonuclease
MRSVPDTAAIDLAPDWVCEVLSPRTRRFDTTEKRDLYGRNGVGHLWYVDPDARTLEVFQHREGAWVLVGALKEAEEVRMPPFEAIAFPLSTLWAD